MDATDISIEHAGVTLRGAAEGSGPPLVLLHGLTATRRYVTQGSRLLQKEGYRAIAYDARGHGESSPAPSSTAYEYSDLTADLEGVLADLGIERCVLLGSSMGAATAIAFALERPERVAGLVQITPAYAGAPVTDEAELAGWDARAEALAAGDIDLFVARTDAEDAPEEMRDMVRLAVRQRAERHRDLGAVADALRAVPRSAAWDGLDRLAEIEAPVLIVGSRDELDPSHPLAVAQEYERRLPRSRLLVEDEGSTPLAWQGARLSRAILEWLGEVGYS